MTTTPTPLTTKDVAKSLGIDSKTLRVFLRSIKFQKVEGRYEFTKGQETELKAQYNKWADERTAKKAEVEK